MHIDMNGNMRMQKNMQVRTRRAFSKTEGIQLCNLQPFSKGTSKLSTAFFQRQAYKIMAQMSKAPAFSKAVAFSKACLGSFFPKAAFFQRHSSLLIQLGAEVKLWPCELEMQ